MLSSRYVTLRRQKPKEIDTSSAEDKQSIAEDEEPIESIEELETLPPKIITTTTTTTRPKEKVSVFIVTPATDPVASEYLSSTWTSVVTSIMEDAVTHKTKIKVNHTEDGRAMDSIFKTTSPTPTVQLNTSDSTTKAGDIAELTTVSSKESTVDGTVPPTVSSTLRLPLRIPANHSRFISFNRNRTNVQTSTVQTTLKPESETKNKYSRFKIKSKFDPTDISEKKYSSINRTTKIGSSGSKESAEASATTKKYFGRFRSSTESSGEEEEEAETTSGEGPVTAKYKYILRTTKPTVSKDRDENEVNKVKLIEEKIKEILETQEQNEDGQIYDNEIENSATPSSAARFTPRYTNRRSTLDNSRENSRVRSSTEPHISSTRRSFSRGTTTSTPEPETADKHNSTNNTNIRSRGQSKYRTNQNKQKIVDSNEYEGEEYEFSMNNVTPKDKKRVIEVRIRKKPRNPKQLGEASKSDEYSEESSNEQSVSVTTEYGVPSTYNYVSGEEISSTQNALAETTTDFYKSDNTFITTFTPTTEETTITDIVNNVGKIVQTAPKQKKVDNTEIIDDIHRLFVYELSTETNGRTTTDDYGAKSTFVTQTEPSRATNFFTTSRYSNFISRGTKHYDTTTKNPSNDLKSANRVVNNPESIQKKSNNKTYENIRRRTSASPDSTTSREATTQDNRHTVFINRNGNNKIEFNKGDVEFVEPSTVNAQNQETIERINARRKNSRYTSTTEGGAFAQLINDRSKPQRKANVTRNRGSIKAYKNPEVLREIAYEDKANTKDSNYLNGQFFFEVSTSASRRRITLPRETEAPIFFSTPQLSRLPSRFQYPDENLVRAESIYFPLKSPPGVKSDVGEVILTVTVVACPHDVEIYVPEVTGFEPVLFPKLLLDYPISLNQLNFNIKFACSSLSYCFSVLLYLTFDSRYLHNLLVLDF